VALYEATSEPRYLEHAEAWIRVMERQFGAKDGGFYLSAADTPGLIQRTRSAADSAVPSGNGAALMALVRLHALTGEEGYGFKAEALIRAFAGELERDAFSLSTYLNGIDLWAHGQQIVIVADRHAKETAPFLAAVYGVSLPNRILTVIRPGEALPPRHPAFGKGQIDNKPTAYLCRGQTCSLPITAPSELEQALRERAS
jgi:uncharacterized protein